MDPHSFINGCSNIPPMDEGIYPMLSRGQAQDWHWPLTSMKAEHRNRTPLMRAVPYTLSAIPDSEIVTDLESLATDREGVALSMNLSSGGILLVMSEAPALQQVLKVCVPTPITGVETPTLAEVRWSRQLSLGVPTPLYLVGLKFLF